MKKTLFFLTFCLNLGIAMAQSWDDDYILNFDQPQYLFHLKIDTLNYPGRSWQMGPPQKDIFNESFSYPNVMVTDTLDPYPVNDTSVFIIKNLGTQGVMYGIEVLQGFYYVNSDSLNDYGLIEFSPDNGLNWIDLVNDTSSLPNISWWSEKPVLTGNSNGWIYFEVMLMDIGSAFRMNFGDTIRYRFSFISDNVPEELDGLMYDSFMFYEFIEGISEIRFKSIKSTISPNPGKDLFRIDFENPYNDSFQLNIYDEKSRLMYSNDNVKGVFAEFNAKGLSSGIYFYKLTNNIRHERSWGKFVVL
jgi:hypothetical protein